MNAEIPPQGDPKLEALLEALKVKPDGEVMEQVLEVNDEANLQKTLETAAADAKANNAIRQVSFKGTEYYVGPESEV